MPKITIISNNAFSLVNFRRHFIKDLVHTGSEVFALAPDYTTDFRSQIKDTGAKPVDFFMERTGQNVIEDLRAVYSIYTALRKLNPDITFSYGIKPVIYGLWASHLGNVEKIYAMIAGLGSVYVNGKNTSLKDTLTKKTADLLYKSALRFADNIFFQNPDDMQLFVENDIVDIDKTTLVNGSGVDIDYYDTGNIQKAPLTFTLVSRLIKEKGIYEFIDSAQELRTKFPRKDIDFVLLGDVDSNPNSVQKYELESWVNEGIIRWPGHVDNVKEWLEKTSVFVLPTYYREGTPKSILEAMSMGLPIITTDMPGCREAVSNGENGFLIPAKDVSALTDAMTEFVRDPSLLESMGSESRKVAVEKYDVRKVNKKILGSMGLS